MKKKVVSLLMCAAMSFAVVTGCTSQAAVDTGSDSGESASDESGDGT